MKPQRRHEGHSLFLGGVDDALQLSGQMRVEQRGIAQQIRYRILEAEGRSAADLAETDDKGTQRRKSGRPARAPSRRELGDMRWSRGPHRRYRVQRLEIRCR
jgi:hypothetical protein